MPSISFAEKWRRKKAVAGCNTKFFQHRIFKGYGKLRTINTGQQILIRRYTEMNVPLILWQCLNAFQKVFNQRLLCPALFPRTKKKKNSSQSITLADQIDEFNNIDKISSLILN